MSLLRTDLDAFDEALELAGARPAVVKVQVAGPWTLAAGIELCSGHRVLTDEGALADRLGFARETLAQRAVPAPTCGMAGATPRWARRALALVRDVGKAFVEPPQGW